MHPRKICGCFPWIAENLSYVTICLIVDDELHKPMGDSLRKLYVEPPGRIGHVYMVRDKFCLGSYWYRVN